MKNYSQKWKSLRRFVDDLVAKHARERGEQAFGQYLAASEIQGEMDRHDETGLHADPAKMHLPRQGGPE